MFSRFFIDRPIFAAVLSIFVVIAGLASMRVLPVAQYPEIAPPVVTVQAVYPGASAQVLEQTVAAPLENQINGVEHMIYFLAAGFCCSGSFFSAIRTGAPGPSFITPSVITFSP
jgi:multidrug efflux pump subunit AcrB